MGKFFDHLSDDLRSFIDQQPIFFVATSPKEGRINLSPKGIDTFRCLSANEVAYLDLTGSGNETVAHLKDDGRITVMFCSFDAQPLILRLYGHGRVIKPADAEWPTYFQHFTAVPGMRQIFSIKIDSAQTSCGFGVPYMEHQADRSTLNDWAEQKGPVGLVEYQRLRNQRSIDGLPTGLFEDN